MVTCETDFTDTWYVALEVLHRFTALLALHFSSSLNRASIFVYTSSRDKLYSVMLRPGPYLPLPRYSRIWMFTRRGF